MAIAASMVEMALLATALALQASLTEGRGSTLEHMVTDLPLPGVKLVVLAVALQRLSEDVL
jgi:hypothetical protein